MKKSNAKAKREAKKQQHKQNWQKAAEERKQKEIAEMERNRQLEAARQLKQKKEATLQEWQAAAPENRKSLSKAAGVKSTFVVGNTLYMTTFGKGNDAILEKKIAEDGTITSIPKPEETAFSAQLWYLTGEQQLAGITTTREANAIEITNGRIHIAKNVYVGNPLYCKEKIGIPQNRDMLGLKEILEQRYFGTTFQDTVHIQLIYNILDIEKILAEYTTNAVFALDNVSGNTDDFLGNLSTRNPYDAFIQPEKHAEHFNNRKDLMEKVRQQGEDFFDFTDNKRIGYFGKAFFYQRGQKEFQKEDIEIYHILTLMGSLRQWVTHSDENENKISRTWLYQLEKNLLSEYQETLDCNYNDIVNELTKNFTKTNATNLNFLSELLDIPVEELAESYFRFAITKEYKNLGFCIKTFREILLERHELVDIKENHAVYDSIRNKLYKMMDFVLVYAYQSEEGQKTAQLLASSLRAALTEQGKETIYKEEAERLWNLCGDKLLKIKQFKGSEVKEYQKTKIEVQLPPILKPAKDVTCFTKLLYILTMFLDGKEINDLLTTLINKFDNIRSFLEVLEQLELKTTFVEDYAFFAQSQRLCEEITQLKSFARMGKPVANAKQAMMIDAVRILGTDKTEEELQTLANRFFKDENGNLLKKGNHGMRNFIASNVISNTRFHYLIRYGQPENLHKLSQNQAAVQFVLHRIAQNQKKQGQIAKNQIDRYYETCGGRNQFASQEEKIEFLSDIITGMHYDQFEQVKQSDQNATPQEKREKEKYKAIISLYLTVLYHLVKNLVNINARYVIGFHFVERDAQLYDQLYGTKIIKKIKDKKYTAVTECILNDPDQNKKDSQMRTVHEKAAAAKNRYLQSVKWNCKTRENLEKADGTAIRFFRNTVAHLGVVRNVHCYINDIRAIDSYFGLYHYLVQKTLEAECKTPNAPTKAYFEKLETYRTYCKDFLHVLCLPFAYCIPRYKNLSVEQLFDRNETKAEPKDEWNPTEATEAELVPIS